MRFFLWLIFTFLFITSLCLIPDKTSVKLLSCMSSTVRIRDINALAGGSGTVIRSEKVANNYRNLAVTCSHVVSEENNLVLDVPIYIESNFIGWKTYRTYTCADNPDVDLALVAFESENEIPIAKIKFNQKLHIGFDVFHVGCGRGEDPRLDYGKITSLQGKVGAFENECYRTSAFTVPGDSGGPLFYNNNIIGIIQAVKTTSVRGNIQLAFGISFAIPIDRLKSWEFAYNNKKSIPELPFMLLNLTDYEWSWPE